MGEDKRIQEIIKKLQKNGIHIVKGAVVALEEPPTPEEQKMIDELATLVGSSKS